MQTCIFTMLHLFLSTVDDLRISFPYDVHSVIFLNIMFLTILGEAGDMHDYIRDGRHASNPLHGNKYNALRLYSLLCCKTRHLSMKSLGIIDIICVEMDPWGLFAHEIVQ